ncbi:hypothetical protein RBSH_04793 [Rhodopirellula baltica SH28]|uniref:Uncharacterized protein n=2 Tax=Rhodopirellula baltica TaxID=265606 RepID=F2AU63_RHOBT|nr:hypothetical protein RBWH47_02102 [Rhodopirellula baltica WH47]EKJ99709.1 hypothetical protein RBSH_04793 [Rhodopirellula baltica SH28]
MDIRQGWRLINCRERGTVRQSTARPRRNGRVKHVPEADFTMEADSPSG